MAEVENIIIAIDGPAVSGKGTVARLLAKRLGFMCLDTGALYRGMTIYFMDNGVDLGNDDEVKQATSTVDLHPECVDVETHIFLEQDDVTERLHDLDICENVYRVAAIPRVRARIKTIQHAIGAHQNIVCEGRDIGSVVFPNAKFKFYLTATLKARSERRFQMEAAKRTGATLEEVTKMIRARDRMDKKRPISPLVQAEGAIKIDASHITAEQVVEKMIKIIKKEVGEILLFN